MKPYGPRVAAAVSLLCTMFVGLPVSAHDGQSKEVDAKLYEVTENMSLDNLSKPTLRTATAAVQGSAKLGSPLCPVDLLHLLLSLGLLTRADKPCTITAIGTDEIHTTTGSGSLTGIPPAGGFAVVINLDNTTDAAEFVVMTGRFEVSLQVVVDTSVNPPRQLPLITLSNGTFTPIDVLGFPIASIGMLGLDPAKFGPVSFSGVFRLPFTVDKYGKHMRPHSSKDAYYLGDRGQLIKVQPDERSLGFPTLRVEIDF